MATIIDKQCGVIGNNFLGVVRDTQFLWNQPTLPHGAHDLVMNDLTVNAEAGRDLFNRPHYAYNLGTALALMDCSLTLAATASFFPELDLEAVNIVHCRDIQPHSFA